MTNTYVLFLKKILLTIVMTLVTSVIGIILNQVMSTFTNSIPPILSQKKNLNTYEKQIYDSMIDANTITDRLDQVGGLSEIKDDIKLNILTPLKYPKIFFSTQQHILRPSRGIIFYGPPGTGKTMLARAISAEANVPFLSLSLSNLENKYYGESSKLIQAIFTLARKIQPCIVFFDEIDGLMKQRNEFDQSAVYGFKTELLSQIDGMGSQDTDSIFIIGTTNNLKFLDPAIKRRMPKTYEVKLPTLEERLQILRLKLHGESVNDHLLSYVAKNTDTLSGSDIGELIRRASACRLKEQCEDTNFTHQLENATCIEDIYPLMTLKKQHFEKALIAMGYKFIVEDIVKDEDEAPPPEIANEEKK